jgi:hypothetical protein
MSKPKSKPRGAPSASSAARKAALLASSGIDTGRGRPRPPLAPTKARREKRGIAIYMDQIVKDELDAIALAQRRSIQDLGLEAINLLLVRYGRRAIA